MTRPAATPDRSGDAHTTELDAAVDAVVEAAVEEAHATHATPEVLPSALTDVLHDVGPDAAGPADDPADDEFRETLEEVAAAATSTVYAPDPLVDHDDPAGDLPAALDPAGEAALAAARSGVDVRPVETHVDVAAAVAILDSVFTPASEHHYYPPSLLRNLLAAGAPVLLAVDGDHPLGVLLALPGWSETGPIMQSGPMAVVPAARGRRISVALKLAQRAWCLERGVREVRWTYDLMNATTARLNLHTLRAGVAEFLPGYEGARAPDSQALPHDRLLVRWDLTTNPQPPTVQHLDAVDAVTDRGGVPHLNRHWRSAAAATIVLPYDIVALRREDPNLAATWQQVVGGVLREAVAEGWHVDVDAAGRYRIIVPGHATLT